MALPRLILALSLLAAGCSDRPGVSAVGADRVAPAPVAPPEGSREVQALRAMQIGDRFPIDRWLPPSRLDESWTIATLVRAHSKQPVSGAPGEARCEAVAAVMAGHDGEQVSWGSLELICDGKLIERTDPTDHIWALRTPVTDGEVHLELRFAEALESNRDVLWLSTFEFEKGQSFSVQELFARVGGDHLDLLMQGNCLLWLKGQVPRRLLKNYESARAAYRARFDGPPPKAFIFESNEGEGFHGARVSYEAGVGYGDNLTLLGAP